MDVSKIGDLVPLDFAEVVKTIEKSSPSAISEAASSTPQGHSFSEFVQKALGRGMESSVNEEELFAAIVEERLLAHGEEAAQAYRDNKAEFSRSLARADGYVSIEAVAEKALESTIQSGAIDRETGERIHAESFRAAQLDDNTQALYDGRGSGSDPTVAVSGMEAALLGARTVIEQIDSGELNVEPGMPSTTSPTAGTTSGASEARSLDGSGGFLWKPVSESDGNLVVLLPTDLKGLIDKVEIHSSFPADESTLVEQGRFAGDTHNGGRAHFRFTEPGGAYGTDAQLVVFKDDGSTAHWSIGNGAERND